MRRGYLILLHVAAVYVALAWWCEVRWSVALERRISSLRCRIDTEAPRGAVLRGMDLWDW